MNDHSFTVKVFLRPHYRARCNGVATALADLAQHGGRRVDLVLDGAHR